MSMMTEDLPEEYKALAFESGWNACADCGLWQPMVKMVEVEGWYYCPQHHPDITPEQAAEIEAMLQEYGGLIAFVDDGPEDDQNAGDLYAQPDEEGPEQPDWEWLGEDDYEPSPFFGDHSEA